jgi:hypothetical protein
MVALRLALLGSAFCAFASAQNAPLPASTAGIFGRVVNSETHGAVRRAAVKVFTAKDQWDELTDVEGRFRFPNLAPGDYGLVVHRDGYTDGAYTVERSDFVAQKELPVELRPQGVIIGRVVDAHGQPLESAQIQALGSRTAGGKIDVLNSAATNDLGIYRLSGLDPGTCQLRATYRDGRRSELDPTPLTVATSYYGGSEKASRIAVKSGSTITGIDFVLDPVRPATLRGTLRTETGILTERATMWIMGRSGEGGHNDTGKQDGTFEIADVAPGTYTISAETPRSKPPLFGIATVEVLGDDLDSIGIVLKPVPIIEGELQVEGGGSADLGAGSVYFSQTDQISMMSMLIGHPDKDRKFTIALVPGEYSLTFDPPIVKMGVQRVTLDGKSITDWKLRIDDSPGTKKLVIVLGSPVP